MLQSRGNERSKIFFSRKDYARFEECLGEAKEKYVFLLNAYVLMTNHYHLIVETPEKNLSRIMHYLNGSYTTYTNIKRKRSGHLFQGRYKAIVVDKESYLLELSRYLHLNPVRAKMVEKPEEYPYSSYASFISANPESMINVGAILGMFSKSEKRARKRYQAFVEDAMGREPENPIKKVYGGVILGSHGFIKNILSQLESDRIEKMEVSHRKALHAAAGVEQIIEAVLKHYRISLEEIAGNERSEARNACIYLLKRHTGASNVEIGEIFGKLTYSAIAQISQSFSARMEQDKGLRKGVETIQTECLGGART
jgi:putative transposase